MKKCYNPSTFSIMIISNKKEPFLLFAGDLLMFILSLWFSLVLRTGGFLTWDAFRDQLFPFLFVFLAWTVVFFIAGLYDKYKTILKDEISVLLFNAQITNTLIAIIFFYFIPYFGIAPKTILFIDLIISFIFIFTWRSHSDFFFGLRNKVPAIIIGSGEEVRVLEKEINDNCRYGFKFVYNIDLDKSDIKTLLDEINKKIVSEKISVMVVDLKDERVVPILSDLYNLIFSGVNFMDINKVYEDVFEREPLSLVKYNWFLENISINTKVTYDFFKRVMDIAFGLIIGIISIIFYPFIFLAIKIEDGGPIFIVQERVGTNDTLIKTYKFRTMLRNETDLNKGSDNEVTKVGNFLRKTRLDELPQIWSVVFGNLSLIGPRPELPSGVKLYEQEIPYYNIRHLIKPGLSGWAQLYHDNHPHHGFGVEQTKEKLSYDLYYLKNRSLFLDIQIGLKTIKKLLSIKGK